MPEAHPLSHPSRTAGEPQQKKQEWVVSPAPHTVQSPNFHQERTLNTDGVEFNPPNNTKKNMECLRSTHLVALPELASWGLSYLRVILGAPFLPGPIWPFWVGSWVPGVRLRGPAQSNGPQALPCMDHWLKGKDKSFLPQVIHAEALMWGVQKVPQGLLDLWSAVGFKGGRRKPGGEGPLL